MKPSASFSERIHAVRRDLLVLLTLPILGLTACASGDPQLPTPRPIVIRSGDRLFVDTERMEAVDKWFRAQMENIDTDPSFWVITVPRDTPSYPWESLLLVADTAKIGVEQGADDAARVYMIYSHYHLMKEMGRIGEFLPGGDNLEGFALERAILSRVSDAWLLGRAVYQAQAFDPLEELIYSAENGYLDALILTARGDEFEEEREAWLTEDPEAQERFRAWFVDTFSREPPGLRQGG
jgi:hypothetical protein